MANLVVIREICERKKMTIRELAHRIGRDESTLQSAIRRGSTNTGTLEAIAKVLEVNPAVFYDGYSPETTSELRKEIEHLQALLKEKERLIEVLMNDRKE